MGGLADRIRCVSVHFARLDQVLDLRFQGVSVLLQLFVFIIDLSQKLLLDF